MERLDAIKASIRAANFGPPSNGLLLSALIYAASQRDGAELETEVMAPYRRDHPKEDTPR